MSNNGYEVIGVDLGAGTTKIARVGTDGQLKSNIQVIETIKDPLEFMKNLKSAIDGLMNGNVKAIGLGIPSWDGQNEMIQHSPNMPTYEGLAISKELRKHFDNLVIVADNDANVAADGERRFGNWPKGTLIAFTLGSGIGGGVILYIKELDRYIKWQGDTYKGAELGHVSIPRPDGRESRLCGCGNIDCMEAHASATAIRDEGAKMVLNALARGKKSLILDKIKNDSKIKPKLLTGEPLELVNYIEPLHVNLAAMDGDEIALKLEEQTAQALAYGIRNVAQIFDPVIIVLAGAMRNWNCMIQKAKNIYENLLGVVPTIPVGVSQLENAGIIGGAALAFEALD
ncbi:MAG: ROK family protein [bacterium]